MRWLAVTVALLATCGGLMAWSYTRDRVTGPAGVTERFEAQAQARHLLDLVNGDRGCAGRCSSTVLGREGPRVWDVVLDTGRWRGCYRVALDEFTATAAHGLRGVQRRPCA